MKIVPLNKGALSVSTPLCEHSHGGNATEKKKTALIGRKLRRYDLQHYENTPIQIYRTFHLEKN